MQYFAGIDPGIGGALAVVSENFQTAEVWDYPCSIEAVAELAREVMHEYRPALCAIEKVSAMPGQGVSSTFKFGMNYGAWLSGLAILKVPHILATPAKWQRATLDSGGGDTKQRSFSMARRLFPQVDLSRKKDHGRSDALLLAVYAIHRHRKISL